MATCILLENVHEDMINMSGMSSLYKISEERGMNKQYKPGKAFR